MRLAHFVDRLPAGLRIRRLAKTVWAELTFPQSCAPGHFYSPIPSLHDIRCDRDRIFDSTADELPEINLRKVQQIELLRMLGDHVADFAFEREMRRFFLPNEYLPAADAIVLAAMLEHLRPRNYIEIGSGFSSALVLDMRDRREAFGCTFIEPEASRLRRLMNEADANGVTIIEKRVQEVGDAVFQTLTRGDILFVDSSHVGKVGSDVNDVLFRVLPLLRPGVFIHFHDILWPFEYSEADLLRGRSWNEAYLIRAYLANNARYQIEFFGSWLQRTDSELWMRTFPQASGSTASSLWISKVSAS